MEKVWKVSMGHVNFNFKTLVNTTFCFVLFNVYDPYTDDHFTFENFEISFLRTPSRTPSYKPSGIPTRIPSGYFLLKSTVISIQEHYKNQSKFSVLKKTNY